MMKKSLILLAALSLSTLAFASPKKYEISLVKAAKAGNTQLAAGNYRVVVDGDKATFTDSKNKSVTIPVKLETEKTKFQSTAVESSDKSGQEVLDAIDLGGTTTKVEFSF
jgi:hypothetical protein